MVSPGDLVDIVNGKFTQCTSRQSTEATGVDEQHFSLALAMAVTAPALGQEPQANGHIRVQKELAWQGNNAVDKLCLDEFPADRVLSIRHR